MSEDEHILLTSVGNVFSIRIKDALQEALSKMPPKLKEETRRHLQDNCMSLYNPYYNDH